MSEYYSTKRVTAEPEGRRTGDLGNGPVQTGMAIHYQDGYRSWCPTDVFERDYRPITAMTFGQALDALERGERVARAGWNGKGMWLALQVPDAHSKMTLPYVYLNYPAMGPGSAKVTPRVPWVCSQTDMLAKDWMVVGDVR